MARYLVNIARLRATVNECGGKNTLARVFGATRKAAFFDLESVSDQPRLKNPERVLGMMEGLVVPDEIQAMPHLFAALSVLADRPKNRATFLISDFPEHTVGAFHSAGIRHARRAP